MLMTFPTLRQVGTSVLASAGLAGLVVGFAARPVLTNLIAGVQLALTQPIRLDDVVIIDDEWGRIEEILSTYVVVRLWDQRRLIVPLSYFVENPFQNWTRTSADIVGTAFIYVDYSVDVERVRHELHRNLKDMSQWDGRAWALQVTDLTERTMQLRALMSAADAGLAFELRCTVRERLVDFIRRNYPRGLPRVRADVQRRHRPSHRSRSLAA
jgi:small-conductance mechanosensitive channel